MLKSLELTNFKSFAAEPQTIPFAPVTIFVGANGSGKSNVFDAIRFLQGVGLELTINEILNGRTEAGRPIHPGIRGGAAEVCWNKRSDFSIQSVIEVNNDHRRPIARKLAAVRQNSRTDRSGMIFHPQSRIVTHNLKCSMDGDPYVESESLDSNKEGCLYNYPSSLSETSIEILINVPDVGIRKDDIAALNNKMSLLGQFREENDIDQHVEPWSTALRLTYREFRFQSIPPNRMKEYVPSHITELGSVGENLSAVLHRICQNVSDKQQLIEWISSLCSPPIVDIEFDETKLGDVLVQLVEEGGQTISARSLSDGTLRFMGLLAALFTVPKGTIILLEEIENGLHPTRIHLLMELLEQFAAERNLQIIATTHSSQVLMGLSESALQDAVLFARDEEHPGTIVKRLGDLDHFEEVTKSTRIDELFTTGWLEFAV